MLFNPARLGLWTARRLPTVAKPFLWAWGQYYGYTRGSKIHWLFTAMGNEMNYRIPFTVTLPNGRKLTVPVNDTTGQAIIQHGYTEAESVALVTSLVRDGSVFFDLGAHAGQFTLVAAGLVGANGQVHSFEPDPETFLWLCRNVNQNRLSNVTLNQAAASDREGHQEFHLGTVETLAASSLRRPRHPSGRTVMIATTSIDSYCAARGIHRIDFMKIDVEGAEIDVLNGARSLLLGKHKPILHIEFHPYTQKAFGRSLPQLADALRGLGYALFRITRSGPMDFWLDEEEQQPFNVLAMDRERASVFRDTALADSESRPSIA